MATLPVATTCGFNVSVMMDCLRTAATDIFVWQVMSASIRDARLVRLIRDSFSLLFPAGCLLMTVSGDVASIRTFDWKSLEHCKEEAFRLPMDALDAVDAGGFSVSCGSREGFEAWIAMTPEVVPAATMALIAVDIMHKSSLESVVGKPFLSFPFTIIPD